MIKTKNMKSWGVGLTVTAICGVVLFPIYWMLLTSLSKSSELRSYPPKFLPNDPQWGTFSELLAAHPFDVWFMNSLKIAIAVLVVLMQRSCNNAFAVLQIDSS